MTASEEARALMLPEGQHALRMSWVFLLKVHDLSKWIQLPVLSVGLKWHGGSVDDRVTYETSDLKVRLPRL